MKSILKTNWTIFFTFLAVAFSVQAETMKYQIFSSDNPPYTMTIDELGKSKGLVIEIVEGAMKKAGFELAKPSKNEPWVRAQNEGKETANSLIFPFARTALREPNFKWITIVMDEKFHVYTLKPKPIIKDFEELKAVSSIGVFSGGAAESRAKELGLKYESISSENKNFAKLIAGRVAAILAQGHQASEGMKGLPDISGVQKGPSVSDLPLWLATSKSTSDEAIEKMKKAIESFKTTPEYQAILKKYN